MANYQKVDDEIRKLFDEVLNETSIPQWVEFHVLTNNKQKEIYRINKLSELMANISELDFVIVINEEIFEQLNLQQQKILFSECLAGVVVSENDAISLEKPNFTTYRGVLEKFGHEEIISLKESIKSLYDKKKEEDDMSKSSKEK